MVSFRVAAKNFSLTYPQCSITKEALLEHLRTFTPVYCCVSQELHEDGQPHLHAAISFATKKNIKAANHFDFSGSHCNIQSTRNVKDWIAYVKKENNFVEFGTAPIADKKIRLTDVPTEELRDYCVNNKIAFGYYQEEKALRSSVSFNITEESPGIMNMYLQALQVQDFTQALILIGPTGCGKTTWAIKNAPKPSIIISHIDQLKLFKPDFHKSIIFDDMSFLQWPLQSQIHLVDWWQPRSIHVRYGTVSIPNSTPKIFTCNEMPFTQHPAISRRIKVFNC